MKKILLCLVALLLSSLACAKTPNYKLRGWTVTPPPATTTSSPTVAATTTPIIIYITSTPVLEKDYSVVVVADVLEIRKGPGDGSKSTGGFLHAGDNIIVVGCKYDSKGEAWLQFYESNPSDLHWVAVTWQGNIFVRPMPGRCK